MTAPNLSSEGLLDLAQKLGCVGVEFRNDLQGELFDGLAASEIKKMARARNLRILALAEVKSFNDGSQQSFDRAIELAAIAQQCGADGIGLIPAMLDMPIYDDAIGLKKWRDRLALSLERLVPMLKDHQLIGFVEPLGFANSTLRQKSELVELIIQLDAVECIKIVHDTFHHSLAGEETVYAPYTGLVHLSGVDAQLPFSRLRDHHRELVGPKDRLKNIEQIRALRDQGYDGPLSFEVFSPNMHRQPDPFTAIQQSQEFITSNLVQNGFATRSDDYDASKTEVPVFH